jgi:O-palmitoleoyl-L-serine hydrolase
MRADSVGAPVTPQQWDYIHEMGGALRTSLDNVTAVFAPACIGHSVLTKRDWQNIKIDDVSLTDALRCWEKSLARERKNGTKNIVESNNLKQNRKNHHKKKSHLTQEQKEQRRKERRRIRMLNMSPDELEKYKHKQREERQQRKKLMNLESKNLTARAQRSPHEIGLSNKTLLPKIIENEPAVKKEQKKRRQQANQNRSRNRKSDERNPDKIRHKDHNRRKQLKRQQQPNIKEPKKCALRLLERCTWPQCNHSCPTLTNPLTGEEMKFLELLTSFGLDMDAVAQALGVDKHELSNMDHRDLIKLFTESAS